MPWHDSGRINGVPLYLFLKIPLQLNVDEIHWNKACAPNNYLEFPLKSTKQDTSPSSNQCWLT